MSSPDLSDAERQAVWEVINSPTLSMGPKIKAFENIFEEFTGCRHAIAVNSGTAGLHLCVHAAGIEEGDYVLTTPFSFISSSNVVLFERAVPIFVDVDPKTGNMDSQLALQAARDLTNGGEAAQRWLPRKGAEKKGRLKAILFVEVFGQPPEMEPLWQAAKENNLHLIDDACEALGTEYKGKKSGTLGDYGVFAFYPNKQITTGEGGIIITNDDQAADLMHALRNQGRNTGDTWLQHTYLGYNYRTTEMSAAMGIEQMKRLEELLGKRKQTADWYDQYLAGIEGVEPPQRAAATSRVSWFVYVIRLAKGIERGKVAERLAECGIPVRPYFLPIHLQPFMIERFGYRKGDFPITEDLGERGLALPFSGKLTEEQVKIVCQALRESIA